MPTKFASGKFAIAQCDRCGFRTKLKDLRTLTIKTKRINIRVCRECWEPDHPQLQLGMYPVNDPQAVRDPRPDTTYPESRSLLDQIYVGAGVGIVIGAPTAGGNPYVVPALPLATESGEFIITESGDSIVTETTGS